MRFASMECASSPKSAHQLFQTQYEADNGIDGEMRKFCKECVVKKHNTGAVMCLEVADLSGANNNDA